MRISLWVEDLSAAAITALAVAAMGLIGGKEPQIAAEIHQLAEEKKQALVGIPCATWICQKSHDHEPCGRNSNTACATSADLTERTK